MDPASTSKQSGNVLYKKFLEDTIKLECMCLLCLYAVTAWQGVIG